MKHVMRLPVDGRPPLLKENPLMQHSARIASAAVAAALMMGVAGPVASAQAVSPAHTKHAKVAPVKHTKATKATKTPKAAKAAAKDKRLVLKDIAHVDTMLGKVATSVRASKAAMAEHQAAVLGNIAADRAALADLSQAVKDADATVTDLKQVRRGLKKYRVSNYQAAVNLLRQADALAAGIDGLRAEVVSGSEEALTLDQAEGRIGDAVEGAHAITATSATAALRGVKVLLSSAHADVDAVRDALAAAEEADPEEPVTEDPATEDPAVGEPVTDPTTV
jgi:hypothetical protein